MAKQAVLKAADIAPAAFGGGNESDSDGDEHEIEFDLHNLCAFDVHPVDLEAFDADREGYLARTARSAAQKLMDQLFKLPSHPSEVGPIVSLPPAATVLPRAKPVPQPKPETKWEKYARERGIMNKKKDKMVWDEERKEWAPAFGYKRAGSGEANAKWVHEPKAGEVFDDAVFDAPGKKNALKNRKNQLKNEERAAFARGEVPPSSSMPSSAKLPAGIPVELLKATDAPVSAALAKRQRGKEAGMRALRAAQGATASLGKFDTMRAHEPKRSHIAGVGGKKRRMFQPAVGDFGGEKESQLDVLDRVLSGQKRKAKGEVMPQQEVDEARGGKRGKKKHARR